MLQTIITLIIIAVALFFVGRRFYLNFKGGSSGCGCEGDTGCCQTSDDDVSLTSIKHL